MKFLLFLLPAFMYTKGATAQPKQNAPTHIIGSLMIGGVGGWDYLATTPANDWIYVSHGTRVNILNKVTGDSVGVIENTTGVHGISFDEAHGKGFTSNGRLNNVTVFDLKTNKVTGHIATGQNPDAIFLEPFTGKIITCNGRSNSLSIIDPVTEILIDSISLTGKPETAVSDGKGRIYVNIEDKNEVTVVDTKSWKVLYHWSLAPAEGPTGLAIDAGTNKLFAGCDGVLVIIDIQTGKINSTIPIGDGCDGVAFDASTKNIYTSNGAGTLSVIHEHADGKFSLTETVVTKKGARTIALDPATHKIYLPCAEYEPIVAGQKGRPSIKPGTFQVLIMGN